MVEDRINRSQEARCCLVKIRLDWCHLFSYQSPMPAGAGTPRYENCVHRSIEGFRCRLCPRPAPWLATSPSPTFLSCDPGLPLFGRRWLVSPPGAGIHPGSESGTCLRTNRSCRLAPAHQGMKIACIDRSKGSGVVCAPAPPPGWRQAPALHFSLVTLGCRCSGDGGWCRRPVPELIPDRSPGHAFVPKPFAYARVDFLSKRFPKRSTNAS